MPSVLRLDAARGVVEVEWASGARTAFASALLRQRCPCAQCRQLRRDGAGLAAGDGILLTAIEPYGPNAIRLQFSDGHGRGIFPFSYLAQLARELERPAAAA